MRQLTIYRRIFYNADCYTKGTKQESTGVQVHSTGANNPNLCRYVGPDDGRLGQNKYNNHSNRPGSDVCASAYIGKLADGTVAVYQTLPWNYRCWLSGKGTNGNANRMGFVGFEICEDNKQNEAYFQSAVMNASVNLTAHLCSMFGVHPDTVIKTYSQGPVYAVMDHKELHNRQLASNHADITHWLRLYGLTMDDYRSAVKAAMAEGVNVTYVDCDSDTDDDTEAITLYIAEAVNPGAYINLRSAKSKTASSIGRINRGDTVEVLDDTDPIWWQVRYNGVVGYAMCAENGSTYLKRIDSPNDDGGQDVPDDAEPDDGYTKVEVSRDELEAIYHAIGKMLEG